MALTLGTLVPVAGRATFTSFLDELESGTVEDVRAALEQTDKDLSDSHGFRWQSPSVQSKQDRHLSEFRRISILDRKRKGNEHGLNFDINASADSNDHILFSSEEDELIESICLYLTLAAATIRPRDLNRTKISVMTITERRSSMLYWITKGRKARVQIDRERYFQRTNESIEWIGRKIGYAHQEKTRIYLDRHDLSYLIDHDLSRTNVIVHEQHALAWIIGQVCGVRPGSLLTSTKQPTRYLRIGDIQIERETSSDELQGTFIVYLTFRGLKLSSSRAKRDRAPKFLRIKCRSPTRVQDIGLSIPHRILVMLIRRSLLSDHTTVGSLFAGNELSIRIKPEASTQPLLLGSKPKGLGVSDKPMSCQAVHEYLRIRAERAGFQKGVSFYSWRAKTLTTANEVAGLRMTKALAAHGPNTTVFEEYYDQGLYQYDAVGVALDGRENPILKHSLAGMKSERLHRTPRLEQSTESSALINAYVSKHPRYKAAIAQGLKESEMRQLLKRLRYSAKTAIDQEEREIQLAKLTVDELQRRREELAKPSVLFEMIERRMNEQSAANELVPPEPSALTLMDENSEDELDDNDELRDIEDDHEDEGEHEGIGVPTNYTGVPPDGDGQDVEEVEFKDSHAVEASVDYNSSARAFMDLMLSLATENEVAPAQSRKRRDRHAEGAVSRGERPSKYLRKTKTAQQRAGPHYDTTLTNYGPWTAGRWAGAPQITDMIAFGQNAALDAVRSVPSFMLTDNVESVSGPAVAKRFAPMMLDSTTSSILPPPLSAAARALTLTSTTSNGVRDMFYVDASSLLERAQDDREQ